MKEVVFGGPSHKLFAIDADREKAFGVLV